MSKSSLLFLLLRPTPLVTIFYNSNTDKHDIMKDFHIISRWMKQKYANFNVKISETFQWAAGDNICYLDYPRKCEISRCHSCERWKWVGTLSLLRAGICLILASFSITTHPPMQSPHPFSPPNAPAFFPLKWQNSSNWPPGDLTNPELQIGLVEEIKTSEQHFPSDIIKTL